MWVWHLTTPEQNKCECDRAYIWQHLNKRSVNVTGCTSDNTRTKHAWLWHSTHLTTPEQNKCECDRVRIWQHLHKTNVSVIGRTSDNTGTKQVSVTGCTSDNTWTEQVWVWQGAHLTTPKQNKWVWQGAHLTTPEQNKCECERAHIWQHQQSINSQLVATVPVLEEEGQIQHQQSLNTVSRWLQYLSWRKRDKSNTSNHLTQSAGGYSTCPRVRQDVKI